MNDSETIARFIFLRTQGWSYNRIQVELKVSRPTIIKWSRQHQLEIANGRAADTEALAERIFPQRHQRWEILGRQLKQLEAELEKRDFKDTPTGQLFKLAAALRAEISREVGKPEFVAESRENPAEELPINRDCPA